MEINLGKLHPEISKTLVYSLERRFPAVELSIEASAEEREVILHVTGREELNEQISEFTQLFLKNTGSMGERMQTSVLWDTQHQPGKELSPSELNQNAANETDLKGVYLLGAEMVEWIELLDKIFLKYALSEGAKEIRIPSLLTEDHLKKAGYWEREEQQISRVVPRVSARDECSCLSSAACLPLYPVLGRIGLDQHAKTTSRSVVYRWEGGVFPKDNPLSRLWEYQVRELVFFNRAEELNQIRDKYIGFCQWLSEALQLGASMQVATDTFFHAESANMAIYQLMYQTKLEWRTQFEKGDLAVSSFNFHRRHFVEAFDINSGDQELQSACIGFGLERMAYTCLAASKLNNSVSRENAAAVLVQSEEHPWSN
jgi:seryl-tRNA synthetase